MGTSQKIVARVGEREIIVSNLDKVFWPEEGFTKRDLIQYYASVSKWILPHLKDRPLSLVRYPHGIKEKGFYQKNAPPGTPEWVRTFPIKSGERGTCINYILCQNLETLVWMINSGVVEINPWLSRCDSLDRPDFAVFDVDPAEGATWQDVVEVAIMVKSLLDLWKLKAYPKVSGKDGIHIYVPIEPKYPYKEVALFVEYASRIIESTYPDRVTLARKVFLRKGRVYLDYPQNARGQTISCVYGVRALPGAPCSMPFSWEEIWHLEQRPFNIQNALERLKKVGDLFLDVLTLKQSIDSILHKALDGKHNYATALRRQHNLGRTSQKTTD